MPASPDPGQAAAQMRRAIMKEEQHATEMEMVRRVKEVYQEDLPEYAVVQVLYATDRKASATHDPGEFYGGDRGLPQFGLCTIGIATDHRIGPLDVRSIVRPKPAQDFFVTLSDRLAGSEAKDVLVFIHGYNVTFDLAARAAAQLTSDLAFKGAVVLYSWPSQGSLAGYLVDETNVEWTVPHLREFLDQLARRSGARAIHLVVHSMGARAVTAALGQMAQVLSRPAPLFRELVLLAPDVDAEVFRHWAPDIGRIVGRITLYASASDKALVWSKSIHGYPRAGDTKPAVLVVPGMDTIDASSAETSFTGHSYYADNKPVLFDLFNLLRHAQPPGERFGLVPREKNGLRYWVLQP